MKYFNFDNWDFFKLITIVAILSSFFFMSRYDTKGDFSVNDYSYFNKPEMMSVERQIYQIITPQKSILSFLLILGICNKNCARECEKNTKGQINIVKCLDACACNDLDIIPANTIGDSTMFFTYYNVFLFLLISANIIIVFYIFKFHNTKISTMSDSILDKVSYIFTKHDDYEYKKLTDI